MLPYKLGHHYKLCTWQDSLIVVPCATNCSNSITRNGVTTHNSRNIFSVISVCHCFCYINGLSKEGHSLCIFPSISSWLRIISLLKWNFKSWFQNITRNTTTNTISHIYITHQTPQGNQNNVTTTEVCNLINDKISQQIY